jgi:hypothetical protein
MRIRMRMRIGVSEEGQGQGRRTGLIDLIPQPRIMDHFRTNVLALVAFKGQIFALYILD